VTTTQPDTDKWNDLLNELRESLKDESARFRLVFLIDDFMGTGSSLLRQKASAANGSSTDKEWTGKLVKFKKSAIMAGGGRGLEMFFEPDWQICIHHYIATFFAKENSTLSYDQVKDQWNGNTGWAKNVDFSFSMVLPEELSLSKREGIDEGFSRLTQIYYNSSLETVHTAKGGVKHLGFGYGGCALPLVLEHNTPNNSVALLWGETGKAENEPSMRPLFRRRQRHS
jgi:hypothetical protein